MLSSDNGFKVSSTGCKDYKSPIRKADPREYGYDKNDSVTVYTLPKNKVGKLCSFSYKKKSVKAEKLQQKAYRLQSKITNLKNSALSEENKAKELQRLRCELKYVTGKLNCEMNRLPTTRIIVEAGD